VVDAVVFEEIQKKLEEFKTLSDQTQAGCNLEIIKIKMRIEAIENEINSLMNKIAEANETVMKYINTRVAALDLEKKELCAQMVQLDEKREETAVELSDYLSHWNELSISDKITVVDCLIERIDASKDSLNIKWKI
jgi:uncharacterized coiled-coil DUF342 family protein